MHPALKVLLALLALPVLLFGGAFLYGGYLAATGQLAGPEPSEEPASPLDPEGQAASSPLGGAEGTSAQAGPESAGATQPPGRTFASLPEPLDAQAAFAWLVSEGLYFMEAEELRGDAAGFASVPLADAIAVHTALRAGGKEYDAARLMTFAWFSHLPPESRKAFADEVGLAFRPDGERWGRSYIGELCGLYFSQTNDADSIYAQAVRAYCEVAESDAVIQSLRDFSVIQEDPSIGQWFLHVDQKMQDFDPDTLLAIRDAIDLFYGLGDRKYLRAELADLAESKRDA